MLSSIGHRFSLAGVLFLIVTGCGGGESNEAVTADEEAADDDSDDEAEDDDSDEDMTDDDSSTGADDETDDDESSEEADDEPASLCAKYGGPESVASVVQNQVIGAIAADCRVNTFFTTLEDDGFVRVNDCLTIQVQELFGCEGIQYEGAEASNGLPCRSMEQAHLGLKISSGDFDALIEDVVMGLTEAGVAEEDIQAAAPVLLGMEEDIVERFDEEQVTQTACEMGEQ